MSLLTDIQKEIQSVGDEDILADMIIVENPKHFGKLKVRRAAATLKVFGWVYEYGKWVKLKRPAFRKVNSGLLWSEEDDKKLLKLYYKYSNEQLSFILNRSAAAINTRISTLRKRGDLPPVMTGVFPKVA